MDQTDPSRDFAARRIFDWPQQAADEWLGSNNTAGRSILHTGCLNRNVSDVGLGLSEKKPFDLFAEGSLCQSSRGDRI